MVILCLSAFTSGISELIVCYKLIARQPSLLLERPGTLSVSATASGDVHEAGYAISKLFGIVPTEGLLGTLTSDSKH